MNYKLLFPSFLNRYQFVYQSLKSYSQDARIAILHIGAGEGDYDPMLASFSSHLISCDINQNDLNFARIRNSDLTNIEYKHEDALCLSFENESFDLAVAVEVIEHVGSPKVMLENLYRVLKPGGIAILTFPRRNFPLTYDPINFAISLFSNKHLPIGAYAFGHDYLISAAEFNSWSSDIGFSILDQQPLSGYLVGLIELYWSGIVHSIFKWNASNRSLSRLKKKYKMRPGNRVPLFTLVTQKIIQVDRHIFSSGARTLGIGYVLQKNTKVMPNEIL